MNEETRKKILDWIFKNHEHHAESESFSIDIQSGEEHSCDGSKCKCSDGNYPYVNSIKLEEFIKSL